MKIKRTLLISSSQLGEELISDFKKELLVSFDQKYAELLMKKIAFISVNDDIKITVNGSNQKIEPKIPQDNWDISNIWKAYSEKENELNKIFHNVLNAIRSGDDDLNLSKIRKTEIDDNVNILVILPLYKPAESVFLSFLIKKFFSEWGIPDYEYNIVGLLPDLEQENNNENFYPRTYTCISECEKLLAEKQDLINSFALLSSKNDKNVYLGGIKNILPTLQQYLNMFFFNHQFLSDNRGTGTKYYRDKPAFFSSFGLTTYVFKKDRFNHHFENRYIAKTIDELVKKYSEPIERDLFYTDLYELVGKMTWTDKNKLFEGSTGYVPFSKQKIISALILREETAENIINQLEEAKSQHENTHEGYYRKSYLVSLSKNLSDQIKQSKNTITERIKTYLNEGTEGIKKAYALTFGLLGKEESKIFEGNAAIEPLNLKTAREEIAEFYKNYIPKEERILLEDIKAKEKAIRIKQEEADKLLRKIEQIEVKLFGKTKEVKEIEKTEDKLYFTINGQKVNISGYKDIEGPIPDSIKRFEPKITGALPKIVDLRPFMTPVENQLDVGSCTANALVGAYEYLIRRGTNKIKDFSRLFVYYNGREKGGNVKEDSGSAISSCTESLMEKGVCLESTWEYNPQMVLERPDSRAYEEADDYKVIIAEYFETEVELMKKSLAEGFPFVFGIKLYNSFQKASEKGIVPIPDPEEISLETHGLHTMLCVGYSDEEKCFIVRNSWGQDWGDKGYCYIPYSYLLNNEQRCTEYNYLVKTISNLEINEKELIKSISKDSGSLFNFSYDIYDLNAYKENRNNLKKEIEELVPDLDKCRNEYTRQRERVLMKEFRIEAEEQDISNNNKKQIEVAEDIKKTDKELVALKNEKKITLEIRKKLLLKLTLLYPFIIIVIFVILYIISTMMWSWIEINKLVLTHILYFYAFAFLGVIVYGIWAILKMKKIVINRLNHLQDNINRLNDLRNNFLSQLISLNDEYFEIRREHKLQDIYYNFIYNMSEYLEKLKNSFDNWFEEIKNQNEKLNNELPEYEFSDSNIVFNAISDKNLERIIGKQNVNKEYFHNGKKEMSSFLTFDSDLVLTIEGVEKLIKDVRVASRKNFIYVQMQTIEIFDFLFDNEIINDLIQTIKPRPLKEKIELYSQYCTPFIKIKALTDAFRPTVSTEIHYPKNNTEESQIFIIETKKLLGQNITEYDNRNKAYSSLVFFKVASIIPAYVIEIIQESYRSYFSIDKSNRKKLHIGEEYTDYSCFPGELKFKE